MFKAKASKFLAFAFPVSNEQEVKLIVANLKKEYFDARHHSYAYILGNQGEKYRENDDGEPAGTAGKPIHGQLRSRQLTNTLVVVARYFGGTKLGVSGLIEAYKNAASDALQKASIVEKIVLAKYRILFPYEQLNEIMKLVKDFQLQIVDQDFQCQCQITVGIRLRDEEQFLKILHEKKMTSDRQPED